MPAHRTERLLNLVICLLSTRRWLAKEQIRRAVPQYAECRTDEAFDRMFERDKEDLREMGIPLLTGGDSAWFEDEQGYRIDRDAYALPEVSLTPAETAVVGLAGRVWRAIVKLRASGVEPDDDSLVGIEPRVRTAEPSFEALYSATRDRYPVSFTYRTARSGEVATRHVQPWAITSWRGRWYLVAHDRDRDDARVFRLSRVEGTVRRIGAPGSYEVPADADPRSMVRGLATEPVAVQAVLRLREGTGALLRRRGTVEATADGWSVLRLESTDSETLADEIAGFGPDVVVVEPAELVEAVVRRLDAVLVSTGVVSTGVVPQ